MADAPDLFAQLLPAKWSGSAGPDGGSFEIEFPATKFKTSLAHDLVQHKYWKRNGGRIEDTGVAPPRHTFSVPMINTITRGPAERWPDPLYPLHLRLLYKQAQRQATGLLTHPELGELPCKLEALDISWDAMLRSGVDVEISFIETLQDFDTPNPVGDSPVSNVTLAGQSLDASYNDLASLAPTLPQFTQSFGDIARSFQAFGDTLATSAYRAQGFADNMIYRANAVADSLDRAGNALTWPARDSVERIKSAAHTMQAAADAVFGRVTFNYTTKSDMTLPEISMALNGAPLGDLMQLNPRIAASPVVPANTVVRYTAARRVA